MTQTTTVLTPDAERMQRVAVALKGGLLLVDESGRVVWMDDTARSRMDGTLHDVTLPLMRSEQECIDCFAMPLKAVVNGREHIVCVLQQTRQRDLSDVIATLEAVMTDSASWLTRTVVDRIKSLAPGAGPQPSVADLEVLSEREREVLGYICEGRGDAQMGDLMGLSPNTVRNHIASLYRKIGVNRRTAAVIWARERGVKGAQTLNKKQLRVRASKRVQSGMGSDGRTPSY